MHVEADMDDVQITLLELTAHIVAVKPQLRDQLEGMGGTVNVTETIALPPFRRSR